jgi:hypothetical protein
VWRWRQDFVQGQGANRALRDLACDLLHEMIEMAGLDRDLELTLGDVALGSAERCELGVFAPSVR